MYALISALNFVETKSEVSVTGIVNGPLWFKKRIYYGVPMHEVDVEWKNSHIIVINNHTLDLDKGETYSN